MKKNMLFLLALIGALTFGSCKKSDKSYTCATCTSTPRAAAANDASSKGVYIGVLIGSSGTIKFDVMNNGTDITAVMVIDGVTVNLTSSVTWVSGQPYIAPFTGTLNGSPVSITFSVDNNGGSPTITTASVPGHPSIEFTLVKETSTALVEGFEGTYSTSQNEKGTFNILLSRVLGKWGGVARENGTTVSDDINGTIVNGKIIDDNNTQVGTLSGDEINGTFVDGNNTTITIYGKRTL
ncbi:hypothetical protein LK994_11170 [Ferruginibacter lapsinanis]|uniref:hypothetical protein n=1 Tax=Ferruginibacter lapsinanis TaxID=563172 RepID=UPI001E31443B|nr:hypothetical protein [Ferruginibacter lapsinanis]UEG49191.1 hypothetical protein LK994_11170 [Ferruginibacter lapsinanis]